VTRAPVEADFPWYFGPSADGLHEDEADVGGGVAAEKRIESADGEGGASSHAGTGFRRIECVEDLVAVLDALSVSSGAYVRAHARAPGGRARRRAEHTMTRECARRGSHGSRA
jgi:hypothetical protein